MTAARFVGVETKTVYEWLARGEKGEEPFKTFAEDYEKALGTLEVACVNTLANDALKDANTAFRLLEKRYAKRWAREKAHVELSGPEGQPLEMQSTVAVVEDYDYSTLTVEELRTLKALRAKAKAVKA